jgi:hypothetical protein
MGQGRSVGCDRRHPALHVQTAVEPAAQCGPKWAVTSSPKSLGGITLKYTPRYT